VNEASELRHQSGAHTDSAAGQSRWLCGLVEGKGRPQGTQTAAVRAPAPTAPAAAQLRPFPFTPCEPEQRASCGTFALR
jgi:hypothetical protein